MRRRVPDIAIGIVFAIALTILASAGHARVYPGMTQDRPKPFVIKGVVAVKFEDNVNLSNFAKSFGGVSFGMASLDGLLDRLRIHDARKVFPWRKEKPPVNSGMADLTRWYEFRFDESIDVNEVVNELRQDPNIRTVEPVWAVPVDATPNDPEWEDQWAMTPPGPDPNFYTAWDIETGSDSIKIAIVDGGVNYRHPDLIENVWVNPGEDLDGDGVVYDEDDLNDIDDDGNGVVDDLIGYDFFTGLSMGVWPGEDGGIPDTDPNDFNGHGTHVAGIAAAATNNGVDVTGIAGGWFGGHRSFRGCRIMCLRSGALADDGLGYINLLNAATAIDYAAFNGAHVINLSTGSHSLMSDAYNNAMAAGITFCKSAGNDGTDESDFLDSQPGVLSVAAVRSNDVVADFSNFGLWVDVSAPGVGILSTSSWEYVPLVESMGGTSMSSPMVAGLALLIRSAMPSLTKDQVDSIIVNSADYDALYDANPLMVGLLGSGRIDAYQALIDLPNAKFTADVTDGNAPLQVQFADLSPNSPVAWDWAFGNGDGSTDQNPVYEYTEAGIYTVSLKVDEGNPLGWGEEHLKDYIWVRADTCALDSVEGQRNSQVVLPVYLTNTALVKDIQFAFTYQNTNGVSYDSFSVAGLRTEYFEQVNMNAADPFNKKLSILMRSNTSGGSSYLPPGSGAILNLYFDVSSSASEGVAIIDTASVSGKIPKVATICGDYWPVFEVGKISIPPYTSCCVERGDLDHNGSVDIADVLYFVEFSFGSPPGPAPVCEYPEGSGYYPEADLDASGSVDVGDVLYFVEYSFGSPPGPAPEPCF